MYNNCINKNICIELELNTPHIEIELEMGAKGKDGKNATINGVSTLNIEAGENISLEQEGSTLTISGTYEYDDTNIKKSIQENKTNIDTNTQDINNLKQKSDDNKNSIDEINENLKNYSLITETGNKIDVTVNSSTYVMTLDLKDKNDNVLSTGSVDLPIESMIINVTYDSEKKELKFTLQNGNVIEVPLNDLISGLVTDESLENTLKNYALIKDVPTKVSQLENDLDYVKNTDYATSTVAGVVKTNAGLDVDENGMVFANTYNYDEYESKTDNTFISKGTFEKAIKGKNLETANNKVTSVGTGSTDIEYPSAKCVYKIKEDVDNLKSDILETGEVSDSYIHVEDSAMAEYQELSVDGVCEQVTTSGKNLLNINTTYEAGYSTTINGITYTINKDGSITAKGTATNLSIFNIFNTQSALTNLVGKEIILSGCPKGMPSGTFLAIYDGSYSDTNKIVDTGTGKTGTITTDLWRLIIRIPNGATIDTKFYPMIRLSNITDDAYEPYTGGQPSPSPDYPQEIKTITDSLNVTSCNKNLFDKNDENMFLKDLVPDNAGLILSGTTNLSAPKFIRTAILKCKPNTTYTISKLASRTFYIYDSEKLPSINYRMRTILNNGTDKSKYTFTTSQFAKYIVIKFFNTWANEIYSYDEIVSSIQIEECSTQTSFVEHIQSQITANLPEGEFIGKINDTYKDTLKVEYNKDEGQYHLKLYKRVYKNNSYNGESYNYYISTIARKDGNIECGELQTGQVVYYDGDETIVDLGICDMPITYNEVTNIFTDSDLMPQINAKYYKNFISTIQNLQVNKGTLKEELVDIENRLTDLEENVSKLIDYAPIYGIQRNIADNSDTAWERTDDAVGYVNANLNIGSRQLI